MSETIALPIEHIGDKIVDEDVATAAPIRAMIATFDRGEVPPGPGEAIPVGWHGVYFLPTSRPGEMGADGLPLGSGVVPDMPFPRRMYAGARMRFDKPIRVGDPLTRETELTGMTPKSGGTGNLAIVTVTHRIIGPEGICVEEDRVTVFREETKPGAENAAPKPVDPPDGIVWRKSIAPNEVVLFRYSALTFNPHRIHYDAPYATGVEGYPGLVVHGPLSQTYLVNFAKDNNPDGRLVDFDMRARAPLFVNQTIELVGRPGAEENSCEVWALTPSGGIAMSATARFEA